MSNEMNCPRCQCNMPPIEVRGNMQCQVCKLIVQDCCSGETCESGFVDADIKDEPTGRITTIRYDAVMDEAKNGDK